MRVELPHALPKVFIVFSIGPIGSPSRLPTEAAWQHFQATRTTTPDQADILKKSFTEIILASACKGEREVEKLKAIALRALGDAKWPCMLVHLHTVSV